MFWKFLIPLFNIHKAKLKTKTDKASCKSEIVTFVYWQKLYGLHFQTEYLPLDNRKNKRAVLRMICKYATILMKHDSLKLVELL